MKKFIKIAFLPVLSLLTGCATMQHQAVRGDLPKPGEIIQIVYTANREGEVVVLWEPVGTKEVATFRNARMVRTEGFHFSGLPLNPEPNDLFLVHKDIEQLLWFERIGTVQ